MLKSYLRTRLMKITRHAKFIMSSDVLRGRLSNAEKELIAQPYVDLMDNHLQRSFLNDLPKQMQKLQGKVGEISMVSEPDLNEYIFCKVLESLGVVELSPNTSISIEMNAGDIFAVRYNAIQEFLREGKVHLV